MICNGCGNKMHYHDPMDGTMSYAYKCYRCNVTYWYDDSEESEFI